MRPVTRVRATLAAAVMALGTLSFAAPAIAAEPQPTRNDSTYVDADGVVHFQFDPEILPGAQLVTQAGSATLTASCVFTGEGHGMADGEAMLEVGIEVRFDPASCTRDLAISRYPLGNVPASVARYLELPAGSEIEGRIEAEGGTAAPQATWYGSINARVQDLVGIHVSSTTAQHSWNSGGAVVHGNRWGWYSPSGWWRTSASTLNTVTATNTLGTFQNAAFCNPWASTYTNHYRTEFRGYPSGLWDWGYALDRSGDCSGLLSYHYSATTP